MAIKEAKLKNLLAYITGIYQLFNPYLFYPTDFIKQVVENGN